MVITTLLTWQITKQTKQNPIRLHIADNRKKIWFIVLRSEVLNIQCYNALKLSNIIWLPVQHIPKITFCPLQAIVIWVRIWVKRFYREISVQTDSYKPASVPDAVLYEWTLPRAKKVSTGHFFSEVLQLPPPSSSHFSITKKEHHPIGWCSFLCKDYKKDIFGRFAYDFELSQNILSFLI